MGRWDSRYGRECCCERIQRYVKRLNVIRENEVMGIENCLHGYRKQAGCAIAEYRSLSDDLEKTDIVLFGDDPDTIRANRSNKEKKNMLEEKISDVIYEIVELNETFIHYHAILEQRIRKAEGRASGAIRAYLLGVKKKTPEIQVPELKFDEGDRTADSYYSRHAALDRQVEEIASRASYVYGEAGTE
ncbi:MAG: hypothetical protein LUE19_04190 [Clostridiales bacterium]|nr:hypothetical protein [Clostridiales bacterium]